MGYDRGDSFPFDSEPNGIPLASKSKEKQSPGSYPIQFERKWISTFLSVTGHLSRSLASSPTTLFMISIWVGATAQVLT